MSGALRLHPSFGDETIRVIIDRRSTVRRLRMEAHLPDRRRGDRRRYAIEPLLLSKLGRGDVTRTLIGGALIDTSAGSVTEEGNKIVCAGSRPALEESSLSDRPPVLAAWSSAIVFSESCSVWDVLGDNDKSLAGGVSLCELLVGKADERTYEPARSASHSANRRSIGDAVFRDSIAPFEDLPSVDLSWSMSLVTSVHTSFPCAHACDDDIGVPIRRLEQGVHGPLVCSISSRIAPRTVAAICASFLDHHRSISTLTRCFCRAS